MVSFWVVMVGLPRGIPAASLKHRTQARIESTLGKSSAGNTRGLIEAATGTRWQSANPASSAGNTRGLIEATRLKLPLDPFARVFRGEYPRPH